MKKQKISRLDQLLIPAQKGFLFELLLILYIMNGQKLFDCAVKYVQTGFCLVATGRYLKWKSKHI
ncbi:hypothetical protein SAMN06269250_4363 [Spirosoma fluviale]|uniref:Uncharacterized protein n=1 Tax=Spirosoma fluviale TaxID=1597977 RepID=A0A286GCZ7_9BACT|nr:hypothetical protein SAMN06269250_4363 [Spirosoma fluviale]